MVLLLTDPEVEKRLRDEREATGADIYDEVWDGVYVMPPMPNDEHQKMVAGLTSVLQTVLGWPGLGEVRAGVNVSDREADWRSNYRIPDVAVFLNGGNARNLGTHWLGGPDFAVEIISTYDRTLEKIPFYASIGMRELLLVGREPLRLELLRLEGGRLTAVAQSSPERPDVIASQVVPLTFRLLPDLDLPRIQVTHRDGEPGWVV